MILSIVNGLILLRYYLRDRPKLTVHPINPDVYQWWFKLPSGEFEGSPTRKYGFLAYIEITNRGLRKVSLESWRLYFHTAGFRQVESEPINIPVPKADLGDSGNVKFWPVLGQRGLLPGGDTLIDSGTSISGMAYYVAELYGGKIWNPKIKDGKITGKIVIKDVFGKKAHCEIIFSEKSLEEVTSMVECIEKIV